LRIFQKKNGGPSEAFNFGVAKSSGEIIVVLSGDDLLEPNSLTARAEALRHADVVCSLPVWIGSSGEQLGDFHPQLFSFFSALSPKQIFEKLYFGGNFICASTTAFRRALWDDVGVMDPQLWQLQDYEWWLRAASRGANFRCLHVPCAQYRWHGENLSLSDPRRSRYEFSKVCSVAPDYCSREFLLRVLFGDDFADIDLPIQDAELRALMRCLHKDEDVLRYGLAQVRSALYSGALHKEILRSVF
jgi:GT2 family glycosyltransferase